LKTQMSIESKMQSKSEEESTELIKKGEAYISNLKITKRLKLALRRHSNWMRIILRHGVVSCQPSSVG